MPYPCRREPQMNADGHGFGWPAVPGAAGLNSIKWPPKGTKSAENLVINGRQKAPAAARLPPPPGFGGTSWRGKQKAPKVFWLCAFCAFSRLFTWPRRQHPAAASRPQAPGNPFGEAPRLVKEQVSHIGTIPRFCGFTNYICVFLEKPPAGPQSAAWESGNRFCRPQRLKAGLHRGISALHAPTRPPSPVNLFWSFFLRLTLRPSHLDAGGETRGFFQLSGVFSHFSDTLQASPKRDRKRPGKGHRTLRHICHL